MNSANFLYSNVGADDRYNSGERDLWISVLVQALGEAVGPAPVGNFVQHARRAAAWRWIESGSGSVGSFEWISDSLGLDPETLRSRLKRHAERRR